MSVRAARGQIYNRALFLLEGKDPQERPSYVEMIARQSGSDDLADLIARWAPGRPWSVPWARWRFERYQHRIIGEHPGGVTSVALTGIGGLTVIVSGGNDGMIRAWDVLAGRPLGKPMAGHHGRVFSVATTIHQGQAIVVSGGRDKTVRVWDLETGRPRLPPLMGHSDWVRSVAVGQLQGCPVIVSGGDDKTVRVWDLESGTRLGMISGHHEDYILAIALADLDGRLAVISGGKKGLIEVRDLEKATLCPGQSEPQQGQGTNTQVMERENVLALSGSNHPMDKQRDLAQGGPTPRPMLHDDSAPTWPDGLRTMAFGDVAGSPVLASGGACGTVRLWDPKSGTLRERLCLRRSAITGIAMTERGARLAVVTGSENGVIAAWDLPAHLPPKPGPCGLDLWTEAVNVVKFRGTPAVVAGGPDQVIRCWDLATGRPLCDPVRTGHSIFALGSGVLNGQAVVVTGGGDGTLRSWNLGTGDALGQPVRVSGGSVRSAALMVVRHELLAVCGMEDGSAYHWDVLGVRPPEKLALDARSPWLGLGRLDGRPVVLAGGEDRGIQAFDLEHGVIWKRGSPPLWAVVVGRIGGLDVAVSADDDGDVRIWNLETGEPVGRPLRGHTAPAYAVQMLKIDGRTLVASGSRDRTLRVWDPQTEDCVAVVDVGSPIHAMASGPSGTLVVGQIAGITALHLKADLGGFKGESKAKAETHTEANSTPPPSSEELTKRGWIFYDAAAQHNIMFEEAAAEFDRAFLVDPNNAIALHGRGESYRMLSRYQEAIADFDRSLSLEPDKYKTLHGRGAALRALGRYGEALRDLNRAIELFPKDSFAYSNRGWTRFLMGDFDLKDALADLNRAIELGYDGEWTLTRRARIHHDLGHYQEALTDLKQALTLNPKDATALAWEGDVLAATGKVLEAERDFHKLLEMWPSSSFAYGEWGRFLSRQGRYDAALSAADRAIALDPQGEYEILRQYTLIRAGRNEEAYRLCTDVLRRSPENAETLGNLAETLVIAGNVDEAAKCLTTVIVKQSYPSDLVAYGAILWHKGNRDGARQAFRRAMSRRGIGTVFSRSETRAIALAGIGEPVQAVELLREAVPYRRPGDHFMFWLYDLLSDPHLDGIEHLRSLADRRGG